MALLVFCKIINHVTKNNEKVYLLKNNIDGFYLDGLNIINLKYTKKK